MFLSVVFSGFWSSKLAMEVENLEKWKFIVSWRFKEQKLNKEISFNIVPHFIPYMLPIFKTPLIWT